MARLAGLYTRDVKLDQCSGVKKHFLLKFSSIFNQIFSFFQLFVDKIGKAYFDQHLVCAEPNNWSTYTTQGDKNQEAKNVSKRETLR